MKEKEFIDATKGKDKKMKFLESSIKNITKEYEEIIGNLNKKVGEYKDRTNLYKQKECEMDFICKNLQNQIIQLKNESEEKIINLENKLLQLSNLNKANDMIKSNNKIINKLKSIIVGKDEMIKKQNEEIIELNKVKQNCFKMIETVDFD